MSVLNGIFSETNEGGLSGSEVGKVKHEKGQAMNTTQKRLRVLGDDEIEALYVFFKLNQQQ